MGSPKYERERAEKAEQALNRMADEIIRLFGDEPTPYLRLMNMAYEAKNRKSELNAHDSTHL